MAYFFQHLKYKFLEQSWLSFIGMPGFMKILLAEPISLGIRKNLSSIFTILQRLGTLFIMVVFSITTIGSSATFAMSAAELKRFKSEGGGWYAPEVVRPVCEASPGAQSSALTLSETDALAQQMFVGVYDAETAKQILEKYKIGGVFLAKNGLRVGDDLKNGIPSIQAAAQIPLFIATDQEYTDKVNSFGLATGKNASDLANMDDAGAKGAGSTMGAALAGFGVNMDFAPVVDVLNSSNSVIGQNGRAISSDATIVTNRAKAFAQGLADSRVVPVIKHFPGHGNTSGDSHVELPTTPNITQMESSEMTPFKEMASMSPLAIMTGHLNVPGLTNGQPASMSSETYTYLRNKLNFSGLAITDEIAGMRGAGSETPGKLIAKSINAGADMALFNVTSLSQFEEYFNEAKNLVPTPHADRVLDQKNRLGIMTTALTGTTYQEGAGSATNKSAYIIGDSLTVGTRDSGSLQEKLQGNGWSVTQIQATTGISISASIPKLQADEANIKSASTIIVALGTNDYGGSKDAIKSSITNFMTTLKAINNSATVYWVNAKSTDSSKNMSNLNAAIQESTGYTVLDWASDSSSANENFTSDGIHLTASGYQARGSYIAEKISSGSGGGAVTVNDVTVDNVREKVYGGSNNFLINTAGNAQTLQDWQLYNLYQIYIYMLSEMKVPREKAQAAGLTEQQIAIAEKGMTPEQAAGVVGNIAQESGFGNPAIVSSSGYSGIIQWGGGRLTNLRNFAASIGKNWDDLDAQIQFIRYEHITGNDTYEQGRYMNFLKNTTPTTTPEDAANEWQWEVERYKTRPTIDPNRPLYAKQYFMVVKNITGNYNNPGNSECADIDGGGNGGGGPTSGSGDYDEGLLTVPSGGGGRNVWYFNQANSNLNSINSAYKQRGTSWQTCGCGPTTTLAIISSFEENLSKDPVGLLSEIDRMGGIDWPGCGGYVNVYKQYFREVMKYDVVEIASHRGKHTSTAQDFEAVKQKLDEGYLVFTHTHNHFLGIYAYDSEGKFYLFDSGARANSMPQKGFTVEQLITGSGLSGPAAGYGLDEFWAVKKPGRVPENAI